MTFASIHGVRRVDRRRCTPSADDDGAGRQSNRPPPIAAAIGQCAPQHPARRASVFSDIVACFPVLKFANVESTPSTCLSIGSRNPDVHVMRSGTEA